MGQLASQLDASIGAAPGQVRPTLAAWVGRWVKDHPLHAFGFALLALYVVIMALANAIPQYPATAVNPLSANLAPGGSHPFGTDNLGMDVFSRVLMASRIDFLIAVSSVIGSAVVGTGLGLLAGYAGGTVVDEVVMRLMDMMQAFPAFIFAMAVVATLGTDTSVLIGVIAFINFPTFTRLVRGRVLVVREHAFVEAAIGLGNRPLRLVVRHLLPNVVAVVVAQAPISASWAILTTAGLGFLGLGVKIPQAEWGTMISGGAEQMVTGQWWTVVFPGLALVGAVLSLNLVGDALQEWVDPLGDGS